MSYVPGPSALAASGGGSGRAWETPAGWEIRLAILLAAVTFGAYLGEKWNR